MEHTLIVAGIGPGSKEYILPKALSVIEKARYLVGGHRALSVMVRQGQEIYLSQENFLCLPIGWNPH